jgi:hypothetical protein
MGDNLPNLVNQIHHTDYDDPDITFNTETSRLSKKQLSNLNSIFHTVFDRLKKGEVKEA